MKKVASILRRLEMEPSTLIKKKILKEELPSNKLFQTVVSYALGQDRVFHLTDLPPYVKPYDGNMFEYLDFLSTKGSATQVEAQTLANMIGPDCDSREVCIKILRKDLRCGADAKTFNSVMPGLVFKVPYQRYSSFAAMEDVDFTEDYIVGQLKLDGMFSYMEYPNTVTPFLTRNGSYFKLPGVFNDEDFSGVDRISEQLNTPIIMMGELLVLDELGKSYLSRKVGNGILNSFISGNGDLKMKERIRYVCWNFVTKEDFMRGYSNTPYDKVLNRLEDFCATGKLSVTPSQRIKSFEEAMTFYREKRSRDEEGAIIKIANKLFWKDESSGSPYGIKLKSTAEAELRITGVYLGKKGKKYEHVLGGLVVGTDDDKILTKVGGGFSDEERNRGMKWWNNQVGKIVSVKFTGITTDKTDRKTFCFDHSRFSELRFDKDTTDTYEYCLEELKNAGCK